MVTTNADVVFEIGVAGRDDIIETLLASHPNEIVRFLSGACMGGHTHAVTALLDADSSLSPDMGYPNWWTGLMYAAMGSHITLFDELISRGANPTLTVDGESARTLAGTDTMWKRVKAAVAVWKSSSP